MIRELLKDEGGQDIIEYSLLLVLVGAVSLVVLTFLGTSISEIFDKVNHRLDQGNEIIRWDLFGGRAHNEERDLWYRACFAPAINGMRNGSE